MTLNDVFDLFDINYPIIITNYRTNEVIWEECEGEYEFDLEPYADCKVVNIGYYESVSMYYIEIDVG